MESEQTQNPNVLPELPKRITKREELFIVGLLQGKQTTVAAREAGFSESTALSRSHEWCCRHRDRSKKPHIWDEYNRRLREELRLHEINAKNVIEELTIIAFSSIEKFIDFPTRKEAIKEATTDGALKKIFGYSDEPVKPAVTLEEAEEVLKNYRPGNAIKLKFFEDIPKQLLPAIKSVQNTRDGIKIVLHDKLDALDKLCKYLKLYAPEVEGESDVINVQTINIVVNGSKSPLMGFPEPVRKLAS